MNNNVACGYLPQKSFKLAESNIYELYIFLFLWAICISLYELSCIIYNTSHCCRYVRKCNRSNEIKCTAFGQSSMFVWSLHTYDNDHSWFDAIRSFIMCFRTLQLWSETVKASHWTIVQGLSRDNPDRCIRMQQRTYLNVSLHFSSFFHLLTMATLDDILKCTNMEFGGRVLLCSATIRKWPWRRCIW